MPDPLRITVQNKVYITPILNGEMDDIALQIANTKQEIASLNSHLTSQLNNLTTLQNQFMAMYIQQTGQFPS